MTGKELPAAFIIVLLQFPAATVSAAPLPVRDQNPLLSGFGLPAPMPSRIGVAGEWSVAADFNWGSTALVQGEATEALIVDAETREARFTIRRALSDRIALQLQVPYRYTGAGALDGFIDDWHDAFGLPEGERSSLPDDQIRIAYARRGMTLVNIDSSSSGPGEVSAGVGYRLLASPSSAAAAWFGVKLPTGDAGKLTGSGALDLSLVIAGERRFGERWSLFGQAGATWLGEGDLLRGQQRSIVWSGLAGAGWRAWRGLEFKAQLDAHSAAFDDTELDFLGAAIVLTVGGDYRFESGWQLDVGVSEDIAVETSSDVVFVIGASRRL